MSSNFNVQYWLGLKVKVSIGGHNLTMNRPLATSLRSANNTAGTAISRGSYHHITRVGLSIFNCKSYCAICYLIFHTRGDTLIEF